MILSYIFFVREEISLQHQLIPKYMANWNIVKAVACAERKLDLVQTLEEEMKTLLPSSLLELYEMYRLALVRDNKIIIYKVYILLSPLVNLIIKYYQIFLFQVLNVKVPQNIEFLKEKARLLSEQFGERFLNVFHEKLDQIEAECDQVGKARK